MGTLKTTFMKLLVANSFMMKQLCVLCDVEAWNPLHYQQILWFFYCEVNFQDPIILGRPFLSTGRVLIDVDLEEITFRINNEKMVFDMCLIVLQLDDMWVVSVIDTIINDVDTWVVPI